MRKQNLLTLAAFLAIVAVTGADGKRLPQTDTGVIEISLDSSTTISESFVQEPDTVDAVSSFVIPALIIDASSFDYNSIGTGGEAIVGIGSSDNYGVSSGYLEVSGPSCTSGDADGSGGVDIDDVVYLINYIFSGGPAPLPDVCCGDADGSGAIDIDDVVYLIAYIFSGGPPPVNTC
ncbi:MAG: dockerin type I repeat-containing protein [candidate division Zixibacteria bacterium]|nr:dockerin type I repeat-containing protein [candidate division Zixibacteria bacterium]MBU1469597.1 dockerin type I repeat-containing protein [candidate division Zixibacteria bacterium]MBU2625112.1 dockerin type I repeat-containing protein [candidate division Zixibacteria bacterium]